MTIKLRNVYVVSYEDEEVCHLSTKIGVAIINEQECLHIYLDAVPMNGHLYIDKEPSLAHKIIKQKGEPHEKNNEDVQDS